MKHSLPLLALPLAVTAALLVPTRANQAAPSPVEAGQSQVVTLYAHDDLLSAFNFRTGMAGGRIEKGELLLDQAHMVFGVFSEDMLSFGFIRDEPVNILDLGDFDIPGQRRAKDRAPVLPMSLFHTLFLDGGHFAYVGANEKVYRHKPANRILDPLPPVGIYHLEPHVGHTYLVRFRRERVGNPQEYAKFQIIDFHPGHSVTIRWAPLGDS